MSDEPPSPLLKSRIPRKTVIFDRTLLTDKDQHGIYSAHCPLRKGIICYYRNDTIFEHNIHSSGKHEPRIIVPKHLSRHLRNISFVPIKENRILLFAKYYAGELEYLHLSIHQICSDHRIGPAVWSFNGNIDGHLNNLDLELIKSTENELGITFWGRFDDHWKLFDIFPSETDALNKFPLIESGRIDFDPKFKLGRWSDFDVQDFVRLSHDTRILLNVKQPNNIVDVHYLDSGGTTNFSFVTTSIPPRSVTSLFYKPDLAFSADGSKFAMVAHEGGVLIWDIRSKVPLQTFTKLPRSKIHLRARRFLQFSGGNLGKEILVFVEHEHVSGLAIIHVIDAMSFETEEMLVLKYRDYFLNGLFFDPGEETMYAELDGTIYEWDLRKNEPGPEWWIGDE